MSPLDFPIMPKCRFECRDICAGAKPRPDRGRGRIFLYQISFFLLYQNLLYQKRSCVADWGWSDCKFWRSARRGKRYTRGIINIERRLAAATTSIIVLCMHGQRARRRQMYNIMTLAHVMPAAHGAYIPVYLLVASWYPTGRPRVCMSSRDRYLRIFDTRQY